MVNQTSLGAYRVELKPRYSRDKPWMFRLSGKEDGFTALKAYCENRAERYTLYGGSSLLIIKDLTINKDRRSIDGLVYRGESGVNQDLVNIKSWKTTYRKKKDEAAMAPYYFCLRLEDGRRFGVALLESQGQAGIKGLLQEDMASYFGVRDDPLTVSYVQLVDSKAVEKFAELGVLRDVVLINRGGSVRSRSALIRNSVGGDHLDGSGDKIELHLKKRGGWPKLVLENLLKKVKQKEDPSSLIKAPSMGEIDEVRAVVRIGSRNQGFNLLHTEDTPIRYDITDELETGTDGYATLASIRKAAATIYSRSILPVL